MHSLFKTKIGCVAKDELRYWSRSKLAISVLIIGIILTLSSVIVTAFKMHELNNQRQTMQNTAEQTFMEQPDRHPHRMVHYGHYAFRTPSPLSVLDPGVDAYTGNSIFLEGHRQNSATFAEQKHSTGLTKLGSLSPAFIVQVIAPLLLILIGYSSMSRESESQTLSFLFAQGTSIFTLLIGKGLALFFVVCLIVFPLTISALFAVFQGESPIIAASFLLAYILYLSVWVLFILFFSTVFTKKNESFTALTFAWILFCIVMPRVASTTASVSVPSAGKLETDFAVIAELRKLGDGHNANDPAFAKLKTSLLQKYNVDSVKELPINFRGVVASASEAKLSSVLNQFAEQRMQQELQQTQIARLFGWLSPKVAIRSLSMLSAGTSIETHHRFMRETEDLRFRFVQSLNKAHIEKLSYIDDINRNKGKEGNQKARINATNWQMIQGFNFTIDDATTRLSRSTIAFMQLLFWIVILSMLIRIMGRRAI
ncbi:ABC transporter permease [Aliikangiella sp. IMCC44359]|uniref:ABC transporter permease n=1 Tax=Aliikangiella sp. IMCC44359 TaxID=3459125 RepID=UPI00403B14EA